MNDDDNWVKSAINDTKLVAHVLFKLRQPPPPPPPSPPPKTWTVRQQRSRPAPPPPPAAGKKPPAARASPTTPLSWSGSGDADDGSDISRSKVITNETTPTKRPRKKKTLAELKDDETALLKERKQLKRQIETLEATCMKQRMENERLKKMKNDMKSQLVLAVSDGKEEQKNDSFVLPDLNIPAGEDC